MTAAFAIRMQSETGCTTCGRETYDRRGFGVPMYEGEILPNDWPGEWGGFDVCARCYEVQQGLTEPMQPGAFRLLVAAWFL